MVRTRGEKDRGRCINENKEDGIECIRKDTKTRMEQSILGPTKI